MYPKKRKGKVENGISEISNPFKNKKHSLLVSVILIFAFTTLLGILYSYAAKKNTLSMDLSSKEGVQQGNELSKENVLVVDDSSSITAVAEGVQGGVLGDANGTEFLTTAEHDSSLEYYFALCNKLETTIEMCKQIDTYEALTSCYNNMVYLDTLLLLKYSTDDFDKAFAAFKCFNDFSDTQQYAKLLISEAEESKRLLKEELILDSSALSLNSKAYYIGSDTFCDLTNELHSEAMQKYTTALVNYALVIKANLSAYYGFSGEINTTEDTLLLSLVEGESYKTYTTAKAEFVKDLEGTPYSLTFSFDK